MRSPRRVTIAPIAIPARTLNWAIDFLALVTTGFWPQTIFRSRDRRVDRLRVGHRLAQADIDHDLVEGRQLHACSCSRTPSAAPGLPRCRSVLSGARPSASSCRSLGRTSCRPGRERPALVVVRPTRVGLPHCGQISIKFESCSGASRSTIPAWRTPGRLLVWRLIMFRPATTARMRFSLTTMLLIGTGLAAILAGHHQHLIAPLDVGLRLETRHD